MALRNRAHTNVGIIYLMNQIVDEIFDHTVAIEFNDEFSSTADNIFDPLQQGLEP